MTFLQDLAALTVVLAFIGGVFLWVGTKFFATRKDFHKVNGAVTQLGASILVAQNDITWIKGALGGSINGGTKQ